MMSGAWSLRPGLFLGRALLISASAILLMSCAGQRGAREYMPLTRPDKGVTRQAKEEKRKEVSLNLMRQQVISRQQQGLATNDLLPDGITSIHSFKRTSSDIILIGTTGGNATPLTLDIFVEALQLAANRIMYASLDPIPGTRKHQVNFHPAALGKTSFLRRMVAADYVAKAHVLARNAPPLPNIRSVVDRLEDDLCSAAVPSSLSANMFFNLGKHSYRSFPVGNAGQANVTVDPVQMRLSPGPAVCNARAKDFAEEYTDAIDRVVARYAAIRDLQVAYDLWLLGLALRSHVLVEATEQPRQLLTYWIDTYPPALMEPPTEVSGIGTVSLGRFCVEKKQERAVAITISGGVVFGDAEGIDANMVIRTLPQQIRAEIAPIVRESNIQMRPR